MKSSINLTDYKKDLFKLYCSTSNKYIEDNYIKIAQAYERTFKSWLTSNKKVKKQLYYPRVYDSIILLYDMRNMIKPPANFTNVLPRFVGTADSQYLPYIIIFNRFINDNTFEKIFNPVKDIIAACSHLKPELNIDENQIKNDLLIMVSGFNNEIENATKGEEEEIVERWPYKMPVKRETAKQKKLKMFSSLLSKISNEVAVAADNMQLHELSTMIRNGALAQPIQLGSYYNTKLFPQTGQKFQIERKEWNEAIEMTRHVLSNYDVSETESNISFIKQKMSGIPNSLRQFNFLLEKEKEMGKYVNPELMDSKVVQENINIQDTRLVNPQTLSILSAFFTVLYGKINK